MKITAQQYLEDLKHRMELMLRPRMTVGATELDHVDRMRLIETLACLRVDVVKEKQKSKEWAEKIVALTKRVGALETQLKIALKNDEALYQLIKQGATMRTAIQFQTPIGLDVDLFTTVRLGLKWDRDVSIDEGLDFVETGLEHEVLGFGTVVGKFTGRLNQIPQRLYDLNHDRACRDFEGLHHTLEDAYGHPIEDNRVVTVLIIERDKGLTEITRPASHDDPSSESRA